MRLFPARRWPRLLTALLLCAPLITVSATSAAGAPAHRNGLIAFAATNAKDATDIYTVRPDGTGLHRLTWSGNARDPAWAPQGHRLLFTRGNAIWIMDADGQHKARVIRNGSDPSWAPDGARFTFVSDRTGVYELWIYSFDTRRAVQLTPDGNPSTGPSAFAPSWSPTGDRIVFTVAKWTSWNPYCDDYVMWMIKPDGTGATTVNNPGGVSFNGVSWAPGGHRFAWADTGLVGEGCWPDTGPLVVQRVNGSAARMIRTPGDTSVSWSPNGGWLASARPVLGSDYVERLPEPGLWLRRPDGSDPHRILAGSLAMDIRDVAWAAAPPS